MNRLEAFFYLLMRDDVVPGRIEQIVRDIERGDVDMTYVPSNPHVAAYAEELVKRLTS